MYSPTDLSPRGYSFLIISIITPILASVAVLLRIWVRLFVSKSAGYEDGILIFCLVFYIAMSITGALMALYGFGGHDKNICDENMLHLFKSMFANGIFNYICVISLRVSICLLFLRITRIPWQRYVLYGILFTTTIINIVNLLRINILYCIPVEYYWNLYVNVGTGTCVSGSNMSLLLYLQYIISAVADWTTSLLPIFIMKDWVINRKAKYVTYGLLGMGIFASGAAIAAVVINPTAADTGDYTYTAYGIFVAQGLEPFVGILAASFATYRPLFRSLTATVRERYGGSSNPDSKPTSASQEDYKNNGSGVVSIRSQSDITPV